MPSGPELRVVSGGASPAIARAGTIDRLLGALAGAQSSSGADAAFAAFVAGIEHALAIADDDVTDSHWRLHELALACDGASETLLANGRLECALDALRLGLLIRRRLADLAPTDELFRSTVDIPIEIAASHLAIANAFRRGGRAAEALDEFRAGIAAYRREIETGSDAYALDTLAAHVEDAGRIARDIPDREAMRAHFADSLALRERAAHLAPEDTDLARAFVEACVWRAPDLGKASAAWLDRARRLLEARAEGPSPMPGAQRLRNLVDTAGAPYLSS
jgi:tetratricopeptide (TPR) repeat protein